MVVSSAVSARWGYVRIITGTILGGILGFYFMHRVETGYKEKMQERLVKYEMEKKNRENQLDLQDSSPRPLSDS